jgi:hypothetical protein
MVVQLGLGYGGRQLWEIEELVRWIGRWSGTVASVFWYELQGVPFGR